MAVAFVGFLQSDGVHPSCTASAFGTGYSYAKGYAVYQGGRGVTGATVNSTLTVPKLASNTICLAFIGSTQMYLQSDWTPATGVGNYSAVLYVTVASAFGGVTWESITLMFGTNNCKPRTVVYQESGLGIDITSTGDKIHTFKAAFHDLWDDANDRWYWCFGFANTNGSDKSIAVNYSRNMRYPRPGENILGLGSGIINRGNVGGSGYNEDVPPTAKAHAVVG